MTPPEDWLVEIALSAQSLAEVLDGLCTRLVAQGMPLQRCNISLSVVDPLLRARTATWVHGEGTTASDISHERDLSEFAMSPIRFMLDHEIERHHWMLDATKEPAFELFGTLPTKGCKDYYAVLRGFENPIFEGLRGVFFTFASSRPEGLGDRERANLNSLTRLAAPIVFRITLQDMMLSLMDAYVGAPASRRIIKGAVHRGTGETIEAILMMADLVGFTAASDAAGLDLIKTLDEHLEAMATPVIAHGGSVLKFMGDGMLAAFPIKAGISRAAATAQAIAAAQEAIGRNTEITRRCGGARPLLLDVALNYGEVFYGNVGSPGRLDFTVIGPAVNEVSRIEALCGQLGCSLLMAASVAAHAAEPTVSLGLHRLRGVESDVELFTLASRPGERSQHSVATPP